MIQNHFFLGATFLAAFGALVAFLACFLAIGFLLAAPLAAAGFLAACFFGLAGDLAGDGVEATTAGVEATTAGAGVLAATFGFLWAFGLADLAVLVAFGLLFEAGVFDTDLFCALAIFYYYK